MRYPDRAKLILDLMEGAGDRPVPESALKSHREGQGLSQSALSRRAGVPQTLISMIEGGERNMTPETAKKLAPILGTGARELMAGEEVAGLQRRALKGQLDPRLVLETILSLGEGSEDDETSDAIVEALLSVLKKALASYEGSRQVATKSRQPECPPPTRDSLGRRIDKPYGGRQG